MSNHEHLVEQKLDTIIDLLRQLLKQFEPVVVPADVELPRGVRYPGWDSK